MKHFATIFASARLSARARQIMIDKAAASAQITAVYYSKDLGLGVEGGGGDAKRRMYRSGGLVAYVYIVELRFTKVARKFEYSDREMSATGDLRWLG